MKIHIPVNSKIPSKIKVKADVDGIIQCVAYYTVLTQKVFRLLTCTVKYFLQLVQLSICHVPHCFITRYGWNTMQDMSDNDTLIITDRFRL